jgi:hypothetical protein
VSRRRGTIGPAAIILLVLGLERLVSALMNDGLASYTSLRVFLAVSFTGVSAVLLAAAAIAHYTSRR